MAISSPATVERPTDSGGETQKLTGAKQDSLRNVMGDLLRRQHEKERTVRNVYNLAYPNIREVNVSSSSDSRFSAAPRILFMGDFVPGRVCSVQRIAFPQDTSAQGFTCRKMLFFADTKQ